jgi:hypothetical protein
MANWASTSYAIEGPKKALQKIEQAILHHDVQENSDERWEGNVLIALGLTWEERNQGKGKYMRGFITDTEPWYNAGGALRFEAEEAWGVTDFNEVLEENFHNIKVFYVVEEPGEEIYATNDKEGKYFPNRYYVDTCIDGSYESEYFTTKEAALSWLSDITFGRVKTEEDIELFNADYEDSEEPDENFISFHEFEIIE